ncbi:MAG: efflux RND transporter periplasmic adaptor subunit [Pelagibaca sp.]
MPEMRTIEDDVSAVGTLRPVRAVQIVPDVAGRVTEVPVSSGQQVSEGDLLIQLDDRAEGAAVAEAEATLSEAEQEYRRFERLEETNAAAEARLEEARAAFLRAEARLMRAQSMLEDRAVTAPFGGTLGVIDTEQGTFLTGSEIVTRLSDLSTVEVSVTLPERYFERVTPGQTLEISTPAYPNRTFDARVTLRAPEIDLGTRSFEIRAEVDNSDGMLVGGMFANSRLVLGSSEGMAIPDDAIISEGLATYVYTVTDGTASRTEIEVGASLGPLTEVRDGLEMDSRVVVAGWDQLSDGAPVEIDEDVAQEGLQ